MELYLDVKTVGKGEKGRTACGSSAYRSCDTIIDNAGNVHDYSRKANHVAGGVILPAGAPKELLDKETLWQRHDQKEIRKDAQIFREMELALHNSLSYDAATRVCIGISQKLAEKGMCVQWDIHDTTNKGKRNLHAHFMMTMRDLQQDGTFGKKNRSWNKFNGGMNLADELRPFAAALMNEELDRIGVSDRVEHESFVDRGIDRIPTVKVGVAACAMEEKGKETYKVWLNKRIREINEEHIAYTEKLRKYREARAEMTTQMLQDAQERRFGLDDIINQAQTIRATTTSADALLEPLKPAREEIYQSIKSINYQAAGLRKDAKRIKKIRDALYLVKNLDGDPTLNEEQADQLKWAKGYLEWAGIKDLSPSGVRLAIEEYRDYNTDSLLQRRALDQARAEAYEDLRTVNSEIREIKRQEFIARKKMGL